MEVIWESKFSILAQMDLHETLLVCLYKIFHQEIFVNRQLNGKCIC